jgi:HNH endonuclease
MSDDRMPHRNEPRKPPRLARLLARPWAAVIQHFQSRCVYCRQQFHPASLTRDHMMPKSRGGTTHRNLVPACFACNNEKGRLTPRQYAAALLADGRTPHFLLPESVWRPAP